MSWTCGSCGLEKKDSNESPGRIVLEPAGIDEMLCEVCSEFFGRFLGQLAIKRIVDAYQLGEKP